MNRRDPLPSLFAVLFAFLFLVARPALGQCATLWQPGDPIPSVHGDALATTVWDPDGAGPAPAVLVVGGRLGVGAMSETSLATFDGANWATLGTLQFSVVTALTTWNGQLVAAGGTNIQHAVAVWNGTSWSALGTTDGEVNTLAAWNGNLFVGGFFQTINGVTANYLAQWSGTSWSQVGPGITGEVHAMSVFGSLWVGGSLTQVGTVPVSGLASWNGTSWAAGASFNGPVLSLAARSGTTAGTSFLFAGGTFNTVAGIPAQRIAQFSLSTNTWTAIPGLPGQACRALHVRGTGLTFQLHAAVEDAISAAKVWRSSGTSWLSLGNVIDEEITVPTSLAFFNGQYVAALRDNLATASGLTKAVQMHDGTTWQPARGPGFDDRIRAVTSLGNDIVVAGNFRRYGATTLERIARGSPGNWQPLGVGLTGGSGVRALCTLPNSDLVAGGDFTTAGGTATQNIARWDGATWLPLGLGINGRVDALLPLPNGELIAGGLFTLAGGVAVNNVARWNGTMWLPLGLGTNARVLALGRLGNGDIVATGSFTLAGGLPAARIARWNGASWLPLGSGLDEAAAALAVLPGDDIVVGGFFTQAGGVVTPSVARWNGSAWLAQSTSIEAWDNEVLSLAAMPNGDYFAGGTTSFFGLAGIFGGSDSNLARHTGGRSSLTWLPAELLGTEVAAAIVMQNGDVVVGGWFQGAGGFVSHNVAVLRPTCPAAAVALGTGCVGSAGANVLTATALPWTGSTFRARATGMPSMAVALAVTGFAPLALPLPTILPEGVPGCTLLASPDLLDAALPAGGVVTTQVALPNTTALAGQLFYHQVVPLELDLAATIVAVTATNGLAMTIGVL